MANMIRKGICEEIREAGYFSIQCDETKDVSKKEQISFILRYVHGTEVKEEFLAFAAAEGLNAPSLLKKIKEVLEDNGVDIQQCVAQCYDGASVMSGKIAGVQTLFTNDVPQAVYIHCKAHVLNLVIVYVVSNLPSVADFFSFVQELYVFVSGSNVHGVFEEVQEDEYGSIQRQLKRVSTTRWASHHDALEAIRVTIGAIINTCERVEADRSDSDRSYKARCLVNLIDARFAIRLCVMEEILLMTSKVSKLLQDDQADLAFALDLISVTKSRLQAMRHDPAKWATIWKTAQKIIEQHSLQVPAVRRSRRLASSLDGYLVSGSTGARPTLNSEDEYVRNFWNPVLDRVITELNRRFDDKNSALMKAIASFSPTSPLFLDAETIMPLVVHYKLPAEKFVNEFRTECEIFFGIIDIMDEKKKPNTLRELLVVLHEHKQLFPLLWTVTKIALTLPVTTASAERSFSALKLIKSFLRNSMGDDRLSDLGVLGICRQRAKALGKDIESVVKAFAKNHNNRRIRLF
eukprot:Lithocolla_globosa_v1_NODE_398_length_4181_cov_16.574406.p2 type:complete len:519 gc:universal NODE_398_length_4181_cov_16.574406:1870-314(-)